MAANNSNINSEQFQLLQLSWIERKMAATLFAAPPTASLPEAVQHFLQVFYFDNHLHLFIIIFKLCLQCRPCTPEPSLPPLLCFCHFWALYMYPLFILFFQLASGKAATCPVMIFMGKQYIGTRIVRLDSKKFSFVLRCCVYHLFTHCRLHCTVQTLHHCLHRLRSSSRRGGRRTDCFWPSAT